MLLLEPMALLALLSDQLVPCARSRLTQHSQWLAPGSYAHSYTSGKRTTGQVELFNQLLDEPDVVGARVGER